MTVIVTLPMDWGVAMWHCRAFGRRVLRALVHGYRCVIPCIETRSRRNSKSDTECMLDMCNRVHYIYSIELLNNGVWQASGRL